MTIVLLCLIVQKYHTATAISSLVPLVPLDFLLLLAAAPLPIAVLCLPEGKPPRFNPNGVSVVGVGINNSSNVKTFVFLLVFMVLLHVAAASTAWLVVVTGLPPSFYSSKQSLSVVLLILSRVVQSKSSSSSPACGSCMSKDLIIVQY